MNNSTSHGARWVTEVKENRYLIIGIATFCLLFAVSLQTTESKFKCTDDVASIAPYMLLTDYNWGLRLFRDSDGHLILENTDGSMFTSTRLRETKHFFIISATNGDDEVKQVGRFSELSNSLYLWGPEFKFNGSCALL